jgi:hypothetical protein
VRKDQIKKCKRGTKPKKVWEKDNPDLLALKRAVVLLLCIFSILQGMNEANA